MLDPPTLPEPAGPSESAAGAPRPTRAPGATRARAGGLGAAGLWGVLGVGATFVQAIAKLAPVAAEALRAEGLGAEHVAFLVGWAGFCAYVEGYRAFQKGFCPRVVARARRLAARPRALHVVLAPAFCMGLFHATRRLLISSWCVVVGVTAMVLAVRALPQPWRGLVDAGVLVALSWGVLCLGYFTALAWRGERMPVAPDTPEG